MATPIPKVSTTTTDLISLENLPLLRGVPDSVRQAVLDGVTPRLFPRRTSVIRRSRDGSLLPVLLSGYATCSAIEGGSAREVVCDILGPGDPVNLASHIGGGTLVTEVDTLCNTRIAFLRRAPLQTAVAANAATANAVLQEVLRLWARQERLRVKLSAPSVAVRLAGCLGYLLRQWGDRETGVVPFALNRQAFADMAGTTSETAIRILRGWTKDGWLDVQQNRSIQISNLPAIQRDAVRRGKRSS